MATSTEENVLNKIKHRNRGSLFFVETFATEGSGKAVAKALERLTNKGEIQRIATGIYTRPKISEVFGQVSLSAEEIAEAIAKRDRARIVPTGDYAQHALGLSTQVPLKAVYLTDGAARTIKVGKRTIQFKKTAPKNLAAKGDISSLAIQALKAIGKDHVTREEEHQILGKLKAENQAKLEHDIALAPEWIRKILRRALHG